MTHQTETARELASLAANAGRALQDEKRHYEIACQENTRLRAALARVRALHQQYRFAGDDTQDYCAHCNQISGGWVPWPCPTVRALDGTAAPAAVSAAVAPPTNRAALRDRIAEALMQWAESNNSPQYGAMRRPATVVQNAYSRADAVLAVLPPAGCLTPEYTDGPCHCPSCDPAAHRTNRAAVRAQAFDEAADMLDSLDPIEAALAGAHAWRDAAGLVRHMARQERRMADEGGGPAGADSLAHSCTNCEGADPDTCLVNPDQQGTPAAFLAWAADVAEEVAEELRARHEFERSTGALDVVTELRRMADETATQTPAAVLTDEDQAAVDSLRRLTTDAHDTGAGPSRPADETPDTTADTCAGGSYLTAEHDTLGMIAARHGGDRLAWEAANPWVTSSSMVLPAGLRVAIPAQAGPAAGTALADMARKRNEQMDRADRAEADRKTLGQTALGYQQRAWDAEAELKQAQAALDRVRAAADKLADGTETGFRAALTIREAIDQPKEQPMQHEKPAPVDWKALAEQNERRWKDEGNRRAAAEAERDRAYRERARLVALVAGGLAEQVVVAPASDVDEPGWQILYATLHGRQCSWHFSPQDADLIEYFDHVPADDPRAQWDGHTTEAKYQHIDYLARALGTPGPFRDR